MKKLGHEIYRHRSDIFSSLAYLLHTRLNLS